MNDEVRNQENVIEVQKDNFLVTAVKAVKGFFNTPVGKIIKATSLVAAGVFIGTKIGANKKTDDNVELVEGVDYQVVENNPETGEKVIEF